VLNKKGFTKENRIQRPVEFRTIRDNGKRIRNRHFIINFHPCPHFKPRLGIIITKRHAAKAVERNRIRRQIKEWFRQKTVDIPLLDYVIIATPTTQSLCPNELRLCLDALLQKLNSHCKSYA